MTGKSFPLIALLITFLAACAPQRPAPPHDFELPTMQPVIEEPQRTPPQPTVESQVVDQATAEPRPAAWPTAEPLPTSTLQVSTLISYESLANMIYGTSFTEGGQALLHNGRYLERSGPGSAATIVSLSDEVTYGGLNGMPVAAVVLSNALEDGDPTYSLHIVGLQDDEPVEIASTLLENSAQIDTVIIANNQVAVELVTAGPADPSCCPTQLVVQLYQLHGSELVQTANEVVGAVPTVLPDDPSDEQYFGDAETDPFIESDSESTDEVESEPDAAVADAVEIEEQIPPLPEPLQPGSAVALVEGGITLAAYDVGATWRWNVRPPQMDSQDTGQQIYPSHLLITFDNEDLQEVLAGSGRRLQIYPLQDYVAMNEAAGRDEIQRQVTRLWQLVNLAGGTQPPPRGEMPLLPPPNSLLKDWTQFSHQGFAGGQGVRYVTDSTAVQGGRRLDADLLLPGFDGGRPLLCFAAVAHERRN